MPESTTENKFHISIMHYENRRKAVHAVPKIPKRAIKDAMALTAHITVEQHESRGWQDGQEHPLDGISTPACSEYFEPW